MGWIRCRIESTIILYEWRAKKRFDSITSVVVSFQICMTFILLWNMKNLYIYNEWELDFKKGLISICELYFKYSEVVVLFDEQTKI